MIETIMKKNYVKAFRTVAILAVLLAVFTAVAVPMSLSKQIGEIVSLERSNDVAALPKEGHDGHEKDIEDMIKNRITPLTAFNYAIIGGTAVLWLALLIYYWLLTVAWLYRSTVNEGMNKSLWPILGLFTNLLAVFAFMIIRDRPGCTAAGKA